MTTDFSKIPKDQHIARTQQKLDTEKPTKAPYKPKIQNIVQPIETKLLLTVKTKLKLCKMICPIIT